MSHEQSHEQEAERTDGQLESEAAASAERSDFTHPEIWVGSLADYNNGDLHGDWLDAAREPGAIHTDIQALLASGPAARRGETPEEWGIFDYEGFGPLQLAEYESIEQVSRLARGIAEHGSAFAAFAATEDEPASGQATVERFQESYQGHFNSVADYARQLADDLGYEQLLDEAVPESLRQYVQLNYQQLARDLELGGDIYAISAEEGGQYVFRNV